MSSRRPAILAAAAPPAVAIFIFGGIYGALARPVMGPAVTMLSSLVIFSGAVQFTIVGLLSAGATTATLVAGSATLNLRNLLLGAVLRPRIERSPMQRAGIAWFLLDESAGFALASEHDDAATTLVTTGVIFYLAWQAGTAVGLLGASMEAVSSAAEAVFPILFIGLAALSCTSRGIAVRSIIAAAVTGGVALLWPGGRAVAAVVAAVLVALPRGRE